MEYKLDGKIVSRKEAEDLAASIKWIGGQVSLDVPGKADSAPGGWILEWDYKAEGYR